MLLLLGSGGVRPLVPPPLPQPRQSSPSSTAVTAPGRSRRPARRTRATATTSLCRLDRRRNERERDLLAGKDDGLLHRVHRRDEVRVELSRMLLLLLLLLVMVVIPRRELIPVRFIAVEPGHTRARAGGD